MSTTATLPVHGAAVALFAVSTCGTPGPNNMLMMSAGATFGLRRSIPGIAGVNVGFPLMVLVVGVGLTAWLPLGPDLLAWLRPLAVAYLLWLAWGVLRSRSAPDAEVGAPPGFWALLAFQAVNPKSWLMVLGALGAFSTPGSGVGDVLLIALVFLVCGTPCTVAWCALGSAARPLLRSELVQRAFGALMAMLLALSAGLLLVE